MNPPHSCRKATPADIPSIVQIHQAAFQDFFMTLLGPRFLDSYYRMVMDFPGGVLLVCEGDCSPDGFVSGFVDPAGFYLHMRRNRLKLLGSVLRRVLARPGLLRRLVASYNQSRQSSRAPRDGACELSSIGVLPSRSGQGIGGDLVRAFAEAVRGRANAIVLTTDAEDNEPANRFYAGLGFLREGSIQRSKGRELNIYRLNLLH